MKSEKSFDSWNKKKKKIEDNLSKKICNIWEFWWFDIWINCWWELSANEPFTRICLILNNNLWSDNILIIPLSTKFDNENWLKEKFYEKIEKFECYWLKNQSYFVTNHIKVISKKRLWKKISWEFIDWVKNKTLSFKIIRELKNKIFNNVL